MPRHPPKQPGEPAAVLVEIDIPDDIQVAHGKATAHSGCGGIVIRDGKAYASFDPRRFDPQAAAAVQKLLATRKVS